MNDETVHSANRVCKRFTKRVYLGIRQRRIYRWASFIRSHSVSLRRLRRELAVTVVAIKNGYLKF